MNTLKIKILNTILLSLVCMASMPLWAQTSRLPLGELNLETSNINQPYNSFAFNLLKQVAKEQPTQNVFISPFSVSTALQMVSSGAAGKTKSEIQQTLQTDSLKPETLNSIYKYLIESLNSQTNVVLNLANGMWYQKGFPVKPNFTENIKTNFQAEPGKVDFKKPSAAKTINDWANKETKGKINNIVSYPFPIATKVIVANAIYFKGTWRDPFDKSLTKPRDFYLADGNVKKALMMFKQEAFKYQENTNFQAIQLDYRRGEMQMSVFLPATNTSPEQLLAGFNQDWFEKLSQFSSQEGTLVFPKFKIDYNILLNDSLKALGIKEAFDQYSADFPLISRKPLFISEVRQKSFVAVDEEGTEAAAATEVAMSNGLQTTPPKPFEMIVNRPFLFVISSWTGAENPTILFMGIVNDPKMEN